MHPDRYLAATTLCVTITLIPCSARAQVQVEAGARLGFGVPFGNTGMESPRGLRTHIAAQIPIWVDLGARIDRDWFVGGYISPAYGLIGSKSSNNCDAADAQAQTEGGKSECSLFDLRLGLEVFYHWRWTKAVTPYIGFGAGYEWLTIGQHLTTGGPSDLSVQLDGFEFANLQLGADLVPDEHLDFGPFLALSFGQFKTLTYGCQGDCAPGVAHSESIPDKALHSWLVVGIRGSVVP